MKMYCMCRIAKKPSFEGAVAQLCVMKLDHNNDPLNS